MKKIRNTPYLFLKIYLLLFALICGVVYCFILSDVYKNQNKFVPVSSDYIVILGHSITSDGEPSPWLLKRLEQGLTIYNDGYADKIVVTGGMPKNFETSVASVMGNWLIKQGVPTQNIIFEEKAKNTYENLKFTKELIDADPEPKILVVTNDFHIYRSMLIANKFFDNISGVSSDIPMGFKKNFALLKEPLSIMKYEFIHKETEQKGGTK